MQIHKDVPVWGTPVLVAFSPDPGFNLALNCLDRVAGQFLELCRQDVSGSREYHLRIRLNSTTQTNGFAAHDPGPLIDSQTVW